jgi:hypothetical protein
VEAIDIGGSTCACGQRETTVGVISTALLNHIIRTYF